MYAAQITIVDMNMMVRMTDYYLLAASLEEMSADVKAKEIDCWSAASSVCKMDDMTAKMKMKGCLLCASLAEVMVEMKAYPMDYLLGAS